MPRITVVSLEGIGKWISSVAFEEEDIIQLQQSIIYTMLHQIFRKHGGFVMPISYNNFIILSNGITRDVHKEIHSFLSEQIPFKIRLVSVIHSYPFTAQLKASSILNETTMSFYYEDGNEDPNIVLFLDVSGFIKALEITFFESYINIMEIYSHMLSIITRYGGLACYLGGSIILGVMPMDTYKSIMDVLPDYIRAGIGISMKPRKAVGLARKALYELKQKTGATDKYLVYVDDSIPKQK